MAAASNCEKCLRVALKLKIEPAIEPVEKLLSTTLL
jgi:hypothetical protein